MSFNKPFGIMFHHFHNNEHAKGQGSISTNDFEKIVLHHKDNILSAENWYKKAISGQLSEDDICLTFDDALLCQYDVALPILKKHNLTAFWFVYSSVLQGHREKLEIYRKFRNEYFSNINEFYELFFENALESEYRNIIIEGLEGYNHTDWKDFPFYSMNDTKFRFIRDDVLGVDKYNVIMDSIMCHYNVDENTLSKGLWMSELQVKELAVDGHLIGLHSHTHPTSLGSLPFLEQKKEYELNYDYLKRIIGKDINVMSHPCNSYTEDTLKILSGLGIKLGFRSNMSNNHNSIYEFPREDHMNIFKDLVL